MSNAKKKLLIKLESLIGSECYNSNIQNWGPGGTFKGEGRDFRYPISFYDETGNKIKNRHVNAEIEEKTLKTGFYTFGANQLHIMRGLEKVLNHLETEHGLKIIDASIIKLNEPEKSNEEICMSFLEHLKAKYPLNHKVIMYLLPQKNIKGYNFGTCTFYSTDTEKWATIQIAMGQKLSLKHFLTTVGHEYHHAIEVFRDGKKPRSKVYTCYTCDQFGAKEADLFLAEIGAIA